MPDGLGEAARALRVALGSFDAGCIGAKDCATLAEELAMTEKACAAARLFCVRRAVAHGLHEGNPAAWMARQAGTTTSEAKAALSTAGALEGLEETKKALCAGEVSLAQAHEIAAAGPKGPAEEITLLAHARSSDLGGLRVVVRERALAKIPPVALHRRQHRARRLQHRRDRLGMVCLTASLPPELGLPLLARIEAVARRARRRARRGGGDAGPEPFEAHAADALVALCTGSDRAGESPGKQPSTRAEIVFVCDLFAYRRGHAQAGEVCHIVGGGPVPVSVVADFATDAFVKAVLHDGVVIHTVRHFGRHLSAELRSALDLGPVPGFTGRQCADCGRRVGLEYDHVDPVANHGPTSYDNLRARCYPCHREKTERDRLAGRLGERERRAPRRTRAPGTSPAPLLSGTPGTAGTADSPATSASPPSRAGPPG
ncbi:MAG: HNH endonuclease [Acidimicrobiales bacterium]